MMHQYSSKELSLLRFILAMFLVTYSDARVLQYSRKLSQQNGASENGAKLLDWPGIPGFPSPGSGSETPDIPGIPFPGTPDIPGIPFPGTPDAPEIPGGSSPGIPNIPGLPFPNIPNIPGFGIPNVPSAPQEPGSGIPNIPGFSFPGSGFGIPGFPFPDLPLPPFASDESVDQSQAQSPDGEAMSGL